MALYSSLRTPAPIAILCLTRTCMGMQAGRPYCTTVIAILKSTHQAFAVGSNILASHQVTSDLWLEQRIHALHALADLLLDVRLSGCYELYQVLAQIVPFRLRRQSWKAHTGVPPEQGCSLPVDLHEDRYNGQVSSQSVQRTQSAEDL